MSFSQKKINLFLRDINLLCSPLSLPEPHTSPEGCIITVVISLSTLLEQSSNAAADAYTAQNASFLSISLKAVCLRFPSAPVFWQDILKAEDSFCSSTNRTTEIRWLATNQKLQGSRKMSTKLVTFYLQSLQSGVTSSFVTHLGVRSFSPSKTRKSTASLCLPSMSS